MNPFEACCIYMGIKAHFGDGARYDYSKYGRMKLGLSKFYARNDQYYFKKLATKYGKDVEGACIATFRENPKAWVKDLLEDEAHERYLKWQKNIDGMTRMFMEDLDKIHDYLEKNGKSFGDLFTCQDYQHPIMLKLVLQKIITIETFVCMNYLLKFSAKFDTKMPYDPIWQGLSQRYSQYQKLLKLHQHEKKLAGILTARFSTPQGS
jgi:hypothetical protein